MHCHRYMIVLLLIVFYLSISNTFKSFSKRNIKRNLSVSILLNDINSFTIQMRVNVMRKCFSALLASFIYFNPLIASEVNAMENENSNKDVILFTKELFNHVASEITINSDTKELYNDFNFIISNFNLKARLNYLSYINQNTMCKEALDKSVYDINTIQEYFSISNDGLSKYMIGDTFPGQKALFIRQGLQSLTTTMQILKLKQCL